MITHMGGLHCVVGAPPGVPLWVHMRNGSQVPYLVPTTALTFSLWPTRIQIYARRLQTHRSIDSKGDSYLFFWRKA